MTSPGGGFSGVSTASRGILKIKRKYTELAEDISTIKTKGASAINTEGDRTIFLGMCGILDRRYEAFMERFEEAIDYSETHSMEPSFPTSTDTLYRDTVKNWYYEALGYKETLQRMYNLTLEQSMANLSISSGHRQSVQSSTTMSHKLFLPKIKIKPFNGDLSEWPAFKQLFIALIKEEQSLSDAERFHFLTSYLEGAAYDTIRHIPVTETNFEQAWTALMKVYDDERKLACSYLERFLTFKPCSGKPTATSLQQYLSNVSESITSLKNLNIPNFSDYLLCELALRSLDPITREDFEISIVGTTFPTFTALQTFIQNRCHVLRLTSSGPATRPEPQQSKPSVSKQKTPNSYSPKGHNTSHALLAQSDNSSSNNSSNKQLSSSKSESPPMACFICKGTHVIRSCDRFLKATPQQRLDMLRQYPGCKNCLHPRHRTKECQSKYRCRHCDGLHNSSLHLSTNNSQSRNPAKPASPHQAVVSDTSTASSSASAFTGASTSSSTQGVLLGTVVATIKDVHGNLRRYRGVLDIGSQFSFVTERCVQELGKSTRPFKGFIAGVNHSSLHHISGKATITFLSTGSTTPLVTDAIVVPSITPPLPQVALRSHIWQDYLSYNLSDPNFIEPGEISFLIGADLYTEVVTGAPIVVHQHGPRLMDTIFGFTVIGKYVDKATSKVNQSVSLLSCDATADSILKKFWELEEPFLPCISAPEDEQCENHFLSTHSRTEDGRYVVSLPFRSNQPSIVPYTGKALSRLYSLENKFTKNPQLKKDYKEFMDEYLALGHMSVATCEPAYVIPHHPVYKVDPEGNGKLRVVFDASFRTATGSLNDHLLTGPKLQADIGDIVLNFRRFNFVFTCDIVKMFRQILINPADQQYQQIAWRSEPDLPVTFYQLSTVTYGLRSSPFLAQRVLKQLVLDEGSSYPDAASAILHHTYVDDIATGCDQHEDLIGLRDQLIALLGKGGFELSKWSTNYPPLLGNPNSSSQAVQLGSEEVPTKILGMQWNPSTDTLSYQVEKPQQGFTKRIILSNIARLFDPLRYLTPVTFYAKSILQETWKSAIGWDDEVPNEIRSMWERFSSELTTLSNIYIPRNLPKTVSSYQLIGFSDASEKGNCAVVYLRAVHHSSASLTLLKAKSRLAPLKSLTVPRLELCGAVLLSQLITSLKPLVDNLNISGTFCFTDSTVALAWLQTPPHLLQTFVANRVQQVIQVIDATCWHHVKGTENPADVGSRGILPSLLQHHPLWWSGPPWCRLPVENWPISDEVPSIDIPEMKKTPQLSLATVDKNVNFIRFTERFSSFPRLIRVLAYIKRFIHNCKIPKHKRNKRRRGKAISSTEFSVAKFHCLRLVQQHFYPEAFGTASFNAMPLELRRLAVFVDPTGVLRVGGRLSRAPIPVDHKYPVLLPSRSHLTGLIVTHFHSANHHAGPSSILATLRQQFWIPRARSLVKQCKLRCVLGLNCSESGDCGDEPPCPADSTLDTEKRACVCLPDHCSLPRCPAKAKRILTRNATVTPGDCCDVYECISESEVNCTGVVCPKDEEDCPSDSSRLPKSLKEGDCCGISHGCECFPCSPPSPSVCLPTQTLKVVRLGNRKPGTCCPIYECQPLKESKGNVCIFAHEEKPDGSKWKKNQCSECTCIRGMVHCATNCPPLPEGCPSTTIPKGRCCPICLNSSDPVDSPDTKPRGCMTDRGWVYEDGATWEEDDCTYCTCKEGYKSCQAGMCQQNENSCKLPCEPVFSKDGSGNMLCKCFDSTCPSMASCSKKCKHGYKTDSNGCSICKCDHCKPVDNCRKKCPHGLQMNEKGCPICKCKQSPAINESIDKPTNTSCITEGAVPRDDGEVWFDGCRQCYCYGGKEMCALVSCPKLTCPDPVASKNSCCPICPGNETRSGVHVVCYGPGGVKKEGETWSDGCMECMCHGGRVMCHQELCPPTICTHPLPPQDGSCCPKCPQAVKLPEPNIKACDSDRPAGSQWRRDSCVSCVCNNGTTDCYTQVCNQLDTTCKHPLQVKNQCCSICFDNFQEENTCQMGNVTFSVGDVWEVKKCERCTCGQGHIITCTQTVCESGCSNTNPCCPSCPGTSGRDGGGFRGVKLWMLLFVVSTVVTFALAFCTRYYCQKRHRYTHEFKICEPVPRNSNYKVVATQENLSSPLKDPV